MELFVEYSTMQGGWCVYEQVAYADYEVRRGPLSSQDDAEQAMEDMLDEQ